jgi:hypothetical protein
MEEQPIIRFNLRFGTGWHTSQQNFENPSYIHILLHSSPDMRYVKHKLVKNTLPSHHAKHDDTQVPLNCRRAGKQAMVRPEPKASVVGGACRSEHVDFQRIGWTTHVVLSATLGHCSSAHTKLHIAQCST